MCRVLPVLYIKSDIFDFNKFHKFTVIFTNLAKCLVLHLSWCCWQISCVHKRTAHLSYIHISLSLNKKIFCQVNISPDSPECDMFNNKQKASAFR